MPNELQLLGRAVKQAQYRQHRALDSRLAAVGTTLAQWDALRAISRAPGAAARTLAAATFQSEQAFGTLAGRLAALGLIDRRPGTGRRIEHYLTLRRRGPERGAPDRRRGPCLLLREPVRRRPLRPAGPARARRRFPLKPGRPRAGVQHPPVDAGAPTPTWNAVGAGTAQHPPSPPAAVSGWSKRPAPPQTPVSGRTSSTRLAASRSPRGGGRVRARVKALVVASVSQGHRYLLGEASPGVWTQGFMPRL